MSLRIWADSHKYIVDDWRVGNLRIRAIRRICQDSREAQRLMTVIDSRVCDLLIRPIRAQIQDIIIAPLDYPVRSNLQPLEQ